MVNSTEGGPREAISFGAGSIGPGAPVVVIAEIGINHEGDASVCAEMIHAAAESGADAVKLQTIDPAENYVPDTLSFELFSKAELSLDETAALFELARSLGLEALTTAGDFATLDWVDALSPAAHKISSGLLTHLPLIRHAAAKGRPLLLSTGMGGVEQLDPAVDAAREAGCREMAVFQCTSTYPAPPESLNLRRMAAFRQRYGVPVGFSDHSQGEEAAVAAVAAGAMLLEKHFTLDRRRASYDHRLSLEPAAFARMVAAVRRTEAMLGSGSLEATPEQQEASRCFQRTLVARRDIRRGEIVTQELVGFMRTRPEITGLPPGMVDTVLGRRAASDIARFTPIEHRLLEAPDKKG